MKIQDLHGRLFQAGVIGEVPTGNLLWVDPVNGNDSLAVAGRMTIPFKSLAQARDAASAMVEATQQAVTIMVLPGTYDENDLLRDQVNWYFFPGAVVNNTAAGAIFATGSSDIVASITGFGEFNTDAAEVVSVSAGGADLFIQARRMSSPDSGCVSVSAGSGTLKLQVAEKIEGLSSVEKSGASSCIVQADQLVASGSYCIKYTSGKLHVSARYLTGGGPVVKVDSGGASGELVVDAAEIDSIGGTAVSYLGPNPTLLIRNARIKSATGYAVYIGDDESAAYKVTLLSCVGIVGGAYSI